MKAEDYKDKEEKLLNFFDSEILIQKELSKIMKKDIGRNFYIEGFYFMYSRIEILYNKENKSYSVSFGKDFLLENVSSNFKTNLESFLELSEIISENIEKMIIKYYKTKIFDIDYINNWIINRYSIVIYYKNKFNELENIKIQKEGVVSFFNEEYFNMLKKNIDNF